MKSKRRLEAVLPQSGDPVRVLAVGRCDVNLRSEAGWYAGRIEGRGVVDELLEGRGGIADIYRVSFRGAATACIRLEPDWDSAWPAGVVQYRETIPAPVDGDAVSPRNGDGHEWAVHLVLFSAAAAGAFTFDRYWLVVAFVPPIDKPEQPEKPEIPEYAEKPRYYNLAEQMEWRERYENRCDYLRLSYGDACDRYERRMREYTRQLAKHDPQYTRMWIRWDSTSGRFVPVQNPQTLRQLAGTLPDAQPQCPLFEM